MINYIKLLNITKKLKINNILSENYKNMLKNPDFEQVYWSLTAKGL